MTALADTGEHGREHAAVPAEDVPDGTFGRPAYRLPDHITPTPPEEQARHLADLDEALSTIRVGAAMRRHRGPRKEVPAS
ncbi:hypothetical protein [Streptomyces scabiei]|uniref:hypothetical protein n=1 Tax=Streptomyces scabiei TaxID=1930 RepID=UPI001B30E003|nr:hypothetical protein [Streptomyces sp. LBUM 1475]QTU64254.1 hypothetical protein F3K22_27465 [Streptomyces sp. LBUM 1475]